ncbi:MAG: hypothetical protein NZZ60_05530 [Bacteroidia bacterium]|nr:hypothetical protein [Bacteroidia bacterium]MDW8416573.1 hypothetical protein [Bacteroidia bacterium]
MRMIAWAGLFLLLTAEYSCRRKEKSPEPSPAPLRYVDFEVEVNGECFILRLRDSARIAQARSIVGRSSPPFFPTGRLKRGSGTFNTCQGWHWNWHLHPDSVEFAEVAVEVCDGRPSDIENALSYWIDTVGFYCPWGAWIVREVPR